MTFGIPSVRLLFGHILVQETEAPAISLSLECKTVLNGHRLVNDRIDPVKAFRAVRI